MTRTTTCGMDPCICKRCPPTIEKMILHLKHEVDGVKSGRYSYAALSLDWAEPILEYLSLTAGEKRKAKEVSDASMRLYEACGNDAT